MTSRSFLVYDQQKTIAITIDTNIDKCLDVPACVTLDPKGLPGPAPIRHPPRIQRFFNAFRIHPREHQDLIRLGILRNGR